MFIWPSFSFSSDHRKWISWKTSAFALMMWWMWSFFLFILLFFIEIFSFWFKSKFKQTLSLCQRKASESKCAKWAAKRQQKCYILTRKYLCAQQHLNFCCSFLQLPILLGMCAIKLNYISRHLALYAFTLFIQLCNMYIIIRICNFVSNFTFMTFF